jgi:hypothetical protein
LERLQRTYLERIFGLICCNEEPELKNKPSLFGLIHSVKKEYKYTYDDYIYDKNNNDLHYKFIKVWTGR